MFAAIGGRVAEQTVLHFSFFLYQFVRPKKTVVMARLSLATAVSVIAEEERGAFVCALAPRLPW